jgi:hypothetical protein
MNIERVKMIKSSTRKDLFSMEWKRLWFYALLTIGSCVVDGQENIELINSNIGPINKGFSRVYFAYRVNDTTQLKKVRFFARRGTKDLYLGSSDFTLTAKQIVSYKSGSVALKIPVDKLPWGDYKIVMKATCLTEPENKALVSESGRSLISPENFTGDDFEFSCRMSAAVNVGVRVQPGLTQSAASWEYYETGIRPDGASQTSSIEDQKWRSLGNRAPKGSVMPKSMHDLVIRVRGNTLECQIDGTLWRRTDPHNVYPSGSICFRSLDSGEPGYVDDVKISDLKTGKILFEDDFSSGSWQDKWKVCGGGWKIENGIPQTSEIVLGEFSVPKPPRKELVKTEVRTKGESMKLLIAGKHVLPLFFSCVISRFPYSPTNYDSIRRAYESGIRLLAPIVHADDFTRMDDILAQLRIACPEAYFLLRTTIPVPAELPASDRIEFRDGTTDTGKQQGLDHSKVNSTLSLASEVYMNTYIPILVPRLIDHFREAGFADRVMGFLINGGGYEGGWGTGGMWPKYLVDVSDSQLKCYGNWLRNKYQTEDALRKAWGNASATFENPPVPGFSARTVSDIAGFRDPAKRERAIVNDFLEMYADSGKMGRLVYQAARKEAPYSFITRWAGGGALNTSFGNIQARPACSADGYDELSCFVSIETYGDRKAGGVSLNANYASESLRMRGKIHMQEADLHPPLEHAAGSDSWRDLASAFRREFAVNVLMRQDALWFFDMGFTGPWYDHPLIHDEMRQEQRVGELFKNIKRKTCSEAVIIQDIRQLKYYAMSPNQHPAGEKIPWSVPIHYNENFATHAPEAMVRLGAACDGLNFEDIPKRQKDYKLYLFPNSGFLTDQDVALVRSLAENGAVCVLMGPAGLIRAGKSADLANMEELLGMTIRLDSIGPQQTFAAEGKHPLLKAMTHADRLGSGRWYDNAMPADWHRFYIDDPDAIPLGYYKNGKVGMAIKKLGKGHLVYSAVALTNPKMYRNVAAFAGVHIYLDSNDFTVADENFVTVHTRNAGKKRIVLRKVAREVRDAFTGKLVGRKISSFEVDLPAKSTAVYYIGSSRGVLKRLKKEQRK